VKLIFEECIVSYWYALLLACVPQFDTMHPSVTLGAKFNDRNIVCVGNNNLAIPKHLNT